MNMHEKENRSSSNCHKRLALKVSQPLKLKMLNFTALVPLDHCHGILQFAVSYRHPKSLYFSFAEF